MKTQKVLDKLNEDLEDLDHKITEGKMAESEKEALLKLIKAIENHRQTEE